MDFLKCQSKAHPTRAEPCLNVNMLKFLLKSTFLKSENFLFLPSVEVTAHETHSELQITMYCAIIHMTHETCKEHTSVNKASIYYKPLVPADNNTFSPGTL